MNAATEARGKFTSVSIRQDTLDRLKEIAHAENRTLTSIIEDVSNGKGFSSQRELDDLKNKVSELEQWLDRTATVAWQAMARLVKVESNNDIMRRWIASDKGRQEQFEQIEVEYHSARIAEIKREGAGEITQAEMDEIKGLGIAGKLPGLGRLLRNVADSEVEGK